MTNHLKFLKIDIINHPLFEEKVSFSLDAKERVYTEEENQLTKLFGRNYLNTVTSIFGLNATGKTTIFRALIGNLNLVLYNKSIKETYLEDILQGTDPITIETYFFATDMNMYKDSITFSNEDGEWQIKKEIIFKKKVFKTDAKSKLFAFSDKNKFLNRDELSDESKSVLANDDSIFRIVESQFKYQLQPIADALIFTDLNALIYDNGFVPEEILKFLDPSIEYLKFESTENTPQIYKLKFWDRETEITDNNLMTITNYLSSGTAKAITLFQGVLMSLKFGGIIFIDEIENHFNQAIVRTFIELFQNRDINKHGASLIFITHYSELLDDMDRGDQIYITQRNPYISLKRYSDEVKRIAGNGKLRTDLSKSAVARSGRIGVTSPEYKSKLAFRNMVMKAVKNG
ncbi:ATP/GTP-binding protein [uncultured Fructobacillus sp.]|uniref:AAA family ATPase n=1 Tax=uncultured Fructobacillus sp. TaxID=591942 RepID=UPI00259498B6|nr:AAA family ATPase [uncultured Fructobacillus sp.]